MAFFRVYPGQAETMYHHRPSSRDVFGDALLAGLSQGMTDLEQLLGPYHRARSCPDTCKSSRGTSGAATRKPTRRIPTKRDPPAAWMWWMLGGGDSSDSEEEGSGAPESSGCAGSCPRGRRQCPAEESCAMKRKPSRSASNAPPTKKKEERKSVPDTEDAPKFNFTGRKTNDTRKTDKKETKKSEKSEAEVVLVKPAPWKHVVHVSDDFGPEDVKVYVRDGRIRVEGRRERNVGGDDDVVEVLEVNRELQPPGDVILDDLSVFFRSGGHLELQAPRRIQDPNQQPELVKNLKSMSVDDIEEDADETATPAPSVEQSTETDDVQNEKASEEQVERSEDKDDWEMLPEEEAKDGENEEGNTEEQKHENNDAVKERLEEAAEDEEKEEEEKTEDESEESDEVKDRIQEGEEKQENDQKTEESSVKISEIEEITTKPIVEEPSDTEMKEADESSSNLTLRIVSEDQQQIQIDENTQLMVMNLAGFEPRDVTVKLDGDRLSVRAVRVTEEEDFLSRKESFRSCRVPERVRPSELTCTMGPEAKLVITTPSA